MQSIFEILCLIGNPGKISKGQSWAPAYLAKNSGSTAYLAKKAAALPLIAAQMKK